MLFHLTIFFLLVLVKNSNADHFKGGTLSWKPSIPTAISGPSVDIVFTERFSWTLSRYQCNLTTISSMGIYNDTQNTQPATLTCITSAAICSTVNFTDITSPLYCTDFSTVYQISTGTVYTIESLPINSVFDIAWRGVSWGYETLANSWSLYAHIDLTPLPSGRINTSPGI